MYFFIEKMIDLKSKLSEDNSASFNQIYLSSIQEMQDEHSLPGLHEFGDGYSQGDASDEECNALVKLGLASREENNFSFIKLDKLLAAKMEEKVDAYIETKPWLKYTRENIIGALHQFSDRFYGEDLFMHDKERLIEMLEDVAEEDENEWTAIGLMDGYLNGF